MMKYYIQMNMKAIIDISRAEPGAHVNSSGWSSWGFTGTSHLYSA